MQACSKRLWLGMSDRYNIFVMCYDCHIRDQRRLLFWQKMLSDNVILFHEEETFVALLVAAAAAGSSINFMRDSFARGIVFHGRKYL